MVEQILVAGNHGPCGGVNMSLQATREVLAIVAGREQVYTNTDIVHHTPVMRELYGQGLINFGNDWDKVAANSIVLFSAHGVPPLYHEIAAEKSCLTIDVTCQLVSRQHTLVRKAEAEGKHIIYVGVKGHPETMGVLGEVEPENITLIESLEDAKRLVISEEKEAVVYSQTTLSKDEIKKIQDEFRSRPNVEVPDRWDICYATDNRQAAVEMLAPFIDALLVVGSPHSHNSQELRKKGEWFGLPSVSVSGAEEINNELFPRGVTRLGLTSGASVEERYLKAAIGWYIEQNPNTRIIRMVQAKPETSKIFALPKKDINLLKARYNESA